LLKAGWRRIFLTTGISGRYFLISLELLLALGRVSN
jgi:hypothetical protein